MITELLIEGFDPHDLLRLSKDAFYEVIDQEFNRKNPRHDYEVLEAKLEWWPDEESGEAYIKASVTDYRERG